MVGTSTQSCVVICSSLTRFPLVSTLHSGGTNVVVTGSSFGPVAAVQVVTYSSPAAVNGPVYTAVCSRGADLGPGAETLQCAAQPGVGAGLLWSVQVEGQTSQVFNVSTAYRPPTITAITGRVWTACCLLCIHCTEGARPTLVAPQSIVHSLTSFVQYTPTVPLCAFPPPALLQALVPLVRRRLAGSKWLSQEPPLVQPPPTPSRPSRTARRVWSTRPWRARC